MASTVTLLLGIVLAFLLFPDCSTGQDYSVSGTFRSEFYWPQYSGGREPVRIIEGNFFVRVHGCQSSEEYIVTNQISHLKIFGSIEAGKILSYDGTNYYETMLFDKNRLDGTGTNFLPLVKISTGPVPERTDDKLAPLWTAFASQRYFANADPKLIFSPWMADPGHTDAWSKDHRVRADWSKDEDPPGLPTNIVESSEFAFKSGANASINPVLFFSADTVTNFGGMTFPFRFGCKFFWPAGTLVNSFSGTVGTVDTNVLSTGIIPPPAKKMRIIDERFIAQKGSPTATYVHRSPDWPTLAEGESNLVKSFQEPSTVDSVTVKKHTRTAILFVLGVASLAFISLIWFSLKSKAGKIRGL